VITDANKNDTEWTGEGMADSAVGVAGDAADGSDGELH
jgi:hypothetical protein